MASDAGRAVGQVHQDAGTLIFMQVRKGSSDSPHHLGMLLWVPAVLLLGQELLIAAGEATFGTDIRHFRLAVLNFLHHQPPFVVYPDWGHYIYPPSSLILLTPLALVGPRVAESVYLGIQVATFLVAVAMMLELMGKRWWSTWGAGVLLGSDLFAPLLPHFLYSSEASQRRQDGPTT